MQVPDIELGSKNVIPKRGFALVASKIASDPDKTTTIYRLFDELSSRSLVFYQAELAELEEQLKDIDEEDSAARDDDSVQCQKEWSEFERSAEQGIKKEQRRMDRVMKIRGKLEKYHSALANHRTLLTAPPPSSSTVEAFRNWFFHNTSGENPDCTNGRTWGASARAYDDIHDLVALRVPADQDLISSFVQNNLAIFFQTSAPDGKTAYISERSVARFVAIISTVLAAIMLFGAVISLYYVQNPRALLGMVSGWTVIFAVCVGQLTNAKRDQVFGATAAYAAVLVVFLNRAEMPIQSRRMSPRLRYIPVNIPNASSTMLRSQLKS
ncbi:hypothetical protein VTL71DRAFT_4461 [Oculimacula yallundae]|uniref:DUF6594 domain-containing protein n=1 Tax=Oculimacula yallundae TaxID=86028 RepID=A0ABR4C236_9HELO